MYWCEESYGKVWVYIYIFFNIIDFDFIIMSHFSSLHPDVFW